MFGNAVEQCVSGITGFGGAGMLLGEALVEVWDYINYSGLFCCCEWERG